MEATASTDDWPEWVQTWILPYINEPVLYPVAFALIGHVVMLIAPMMLFVHRHRSTNSIVILTLLAVGSAALVRFEFKYRRMPGPVTVVVALTWMSSAGLAWISDYYGVF